MDEHQEDRKEQDRGVILGIDLGTTYCRAGYWDCATNRVVIIPNEEGNRSSPCYVRFDVVADSLLDRLFRSDGTLNLDVCTVGEAAQNHAHVYPTTTVFDAKRLLDYKPAIDAPIFTAPPFRIVTSLDESSSDDGGLAQVEINMEQDGAASSGTRLDPELILAIILAKTKANAEAHLGRQVSGAVLTTPVACSTWARQSLWTAATLARLPILGTICDPVSSIFCYYSGRLQEPDEKTVLVINIGGGQVGAALLVVEDGMFDVLATAGDVRWGGDYFTDQVVQYFLQECQTRELGKGALFSLWRACENIKHRLSSAEVAETTLEAFFANGTDFTLHMTRARFDYLCQDGFSNCATVWNQVLFDSKTDKSNVQEVVLTGGSSRLPGLRQVVSEAFAAATTKVTFDTNHPDESATHGAAIQGAMLGGVYQFGDVLLLNAINLSLGVETEGGVMTTVVKRNTSLPAKKIQTFTTVMDQQTSIVLQVYEGEEILTQDNMLLGSLELSIPPAPRGEAVITVTFDLHAHRFFVVTAVETTTGCQGQLSFDLADGLVKKSTNNERPVIHRQRPIKPESMEMKSIMVGHARTDPPGEHPLDKTEAPKPERTEMKSNNNIEV